MFVLLLAAAGIYLLLGDLRESLVLAASIAVIAVITIVQERRTENALSRLRDLSSPRALVIRNSVEERIPGREVVVGDVLLLREGDRVAADATVYSATALSVDESILHPANHCRLTSNQSPGIAPIHSVGSVRAR